MSSVLLIAFLVISIYISFEDWKYMEVAGEPCLALWVILVVECLCDGPNIPHLLLVGVTIVFFYSDFELSFFGDADFIPVIAFVVFYGFPWEATTDFYVWGAALILSLIVEAAIISYKNGQRTLNLKIIAPCLPALTAAHVYLAILELF